MTTIRRPVRVIPPGQVIGKEIEARGWTQRDLAAIMGRPYQAINEIINGAKQITPDTARELAKAFGTSMDFWMNLEANYRLFLAEEEEKEKEIARRSNLYSIAPVSEMLRRKWIQGSDNTDDLERQICSFLEIQTPFETPTVMAHYRISEHHSPYDTAKIAWVKRVEQLARRQPVVDFQPDLLQANVSKIQALMQRADQIAELPFTLHQLGIHFIIVPHLPYTYLDGAALYIRERPVIAITLRYDRIDWFWFTVLHELAHIVSGHTAHLDSLFEVNEEVRAEIQEETDRRMETESEANEIARSWMLDQDALNQFITKTQPNFSKASIEAFAYEQKRHPGIVLGQLQYRKVVEFKHLRSMLEKVRPYLEAWIDKSVPL
jgi:HTH-type transcriptional regulator/antitoxin HigA